MQIMTSKMIRGTFWVIVVDLCDFAINNILHCSMPYLPQRLINIWARVSPWMLKPEHFYFGHLFFFFKFHSHADYPCTWLHFCEIVTVLPEAMLTCYRVLFVWKNFLAFVNFVPSKFQNLVIFATVLCQSWA